MIKTDRRGFVAGLASAALTSTASAQGTGAPSAGSPPPVSPSQPRFKFEEVARRARDLSTAPLAPSPALPDALTRLDANVAQKIRFRPERSLLKGSRFRLQVMHLDSAHARPVTVNVIRDGIATPIPYSAALFDYGAAKFEKPLPLNLGFAGLRLQFQLNDPSRFDEVATMTGSSEFKMLGRGQRAGAMLRAISVNAGRDAEEFPFFREFWVETPASGADHAIVYALLDGDSVTGAFRFVIRPGENSEMSVEAVLYPRRIGGVLGIAPITTMFFSGENDPRATNDFHPEIHDSDGLSILTGSGERIWRPLRNPPRTQTFAFLDANIRGFGLMQRDRSFDHYQDLDLAYEKRPSYWVEPQGDWGDGRVELTESRANDAGDKNIQAAWVSKGDREPGQPIKLAYRVSARVSEAGGVSVGRVVDTLRAPISINDADGQANANTRRFMIDFAGGDLEYYALDPSQVEIVASAAPGQATAVSLAANPHIKGLRAIVDVSAPTAQMIDIRVFLRARGRALTETWTLPWGG